MKQAKRVRLGPMHSRAAQNWNPASAPRPFACDQSAFTLVEVMIGFVVMGIMLVALFAGLGLGFREIRLVSENVRATQILAAKMELIRLYNWNQLVNLPGYIPTSFTEPYYANGSTNSSAGGFNYIGTVLVTNAPLTETYASDLRMIQIQVTWTSSNVTHTRQLTTFASQYGLQNYVY
jgi:type II secretory pathway pseudopilin PulG